MKLIQFVLKFLGWTIGVLLLLTIIFIAYVYTHASFEAPQVNAAEVNKAERIAVNDSTFYYGNNWLAKNEFGHFVMYTEGDAYERGLANGQLSKELIVAQEVAFTHQIKKMIPSEKYLKFLKYIIGFLNRGLPKHVLPEYQKEIYGISLASSDSFDWIGDKFSRQLNYHAAHDIGHALQNMMLVGCTSFGAWGSKADSNGMIIGRNFDFWVGDEFAENKIVSFVRPKEGYPFGFVTWGAFIGVSSGMNNQGVTVTINAAKSSIPFDAATPVSLVAREILQYAKNIDEATAIASKRKMFVSESFLIGSASDNKAVIVEKTPTQMDVYDPNQETILCANHFQSNILSKESNNVQQKAESASVYRYQRLQQLMQLQAVHTPTAVAEILRDKQGLNNENIGLGNEKAINQLIAHHSVIFQPEKLLMWVSTSPWQMGTYVCYDLKKVFSNSHTFGDSIIRYAYNIPADSTFLKSEAYQQFQTFRQQKELFTFGNKALFQPEATVAANPHLYDAYRLAGDFYFLQKKYPLAQKYYTQALSKEIATLNERKAIEKKLAEVALLMK